MFTVTVYAASSQKTSQAYLDIAADMGARIGHRGWRLMFGGGRHGLMGAVSSAARAAGGEICGVILDQFIERDLHCTETSDMHTVTDMRKRKQGLDEAGDSYVALPGGFGTFEELLEIISLKQLGFHDKPVIIVNAEGYYDPLLSMFERGFEHGFIAERHRELFTVADTPAAAEIAIEPFAKI